MRRIDIVEGFQGVAFGTMDGLITILGVVIGIASATESSAIVVISGLVAGVANAFGNSSDFTLPNWLKEPNTFTKTNMSVVWLRQGEAPFSHL